MIPDDKYFCFEKTILLFTLFWYAGQPCSFPYSTDVSYQSPIIFFIESELKNFFTDFQGTIIFFNEFQGTIIFLQFYTAPPPPWIYDGQCLISSALKAFNNIWKTGEFLPSRREVTIIPIAKPEKDSKDPNNYRPMA